MLAFAALFLYHHWPAASILSTFNPIPPLAQKSYLSSLEFLSPVYLDFMIQTAKVLLLLYLLFIQSAVWNLWNLGIFLPMESYLPWIPAILTYFLILVFLKITFILFYLCF